MKRRSFALIASAFLLLPMQGNVSAHNVNHQGRAPDAADASRIKVKVVDRPVLDQDGVAHSFARDMVGNRLVVVNFIYTTCGTLCPLQSAVMATLQGDLGNRLEQSVRLVSITVDPAGDRPAQLHEQAERFGAMRGWNFLTGETKDIEVILTGMQAWVETPEDHSGFFLVGSADLHEWAKVEALASPAVLMEKINEMTLLRHGQH